MGSGVDQRAREHNPYVHGLRGLLSIFVYTYHIIRSDVATFDAIRAGPIKLAVHQLEWGVDLFFGISGFVILGALLRAPTPGQFLLERAIRIYPVLWPPLLVSLAWGLMFRHRDFAQASVETVLLSIPANLAAIPGMVTMFLIHPPAWSLSYEMAFYSFCAVAMLLHRRMGWAGAAIWGPVAVLALIHYPRGMFFASGVLVAVGLVARYAPFRSLARFPIVMLVITLGALGGVQAVTGERHMIWTTMRDWAGDARLPLALLAMLSGTLFLQGVVNGIGPLGRALTLPVIRFYGTVSYSFYLWHVPALSLTRRGMVALGIDVWAGQAAQAVLWVLTLPLASLIAYLSYRFIEAGVCPWLRRHLRPRPRPVARAVTP